MKTEMAAKRASLTWVGVAHLTEVGVCMYAHLKEVGANMDVQIEARVTEVSGYMDAQIEAHVTYLMEVCAYMDVQTDAPWLMEAHAHLL